MSDFKVEVPVTCERTGKIERVEMTLADAADYQRTLETKKASTLAVEDFLRALPPEQPDLIVSFRGKSVVLTTVASNKDSTVLKLLHDLTLSNIFPSDATEENKTRSSGKRARTISVDID